MKKSQGDASSLGSNAKDDDAGNDAANGKLSFIRSVLV
jgi:hypothetical protein